MAEIKVVQKKYIVSYIDRTTSNKPIILERVIYAFDISEVVQIAVVKMVEKDDTIWEKEIVKIELVPSVEK